MRRFADVVVVAMVCLLLALGVMAGERGRAAEAERQYDALVTTTSAQVETWLDQHLAFQRAVAFLEPDEAELASAFAPSYVAFALLLDGDGRVLATYPDRPDIGPGDDMTGRFPHIDDVLAGSEVAYWASGAATTSSGSVAAVGVAGPGQPASVLTTAFDLSDTSLPDLVAQSLAVLDGSSWSITERTTGVTVASSPRLAQDNEQLSAQRGWDVRIAAPDAAVAGLVGGVASVPLRIGAVLVAAAVVGLAVWRRRRLSESAGLGLGGDLQVFDASSVASLLLEEESGRIVRANRSMASQVGITARELVGAPFDRVLVPSDDPLIGESPVERRYWSEGEQRWARVAGHRLRTGAEALVLVEVVDVDDERKRHAALERKQATLQDLAGRISHDLRTPITAMVGFADLLQRMPDASADDRAMWARRLTVNAQQLGEYVKDMTEAAAELAQRPATDVRACVERALRMHESSLRGIDAQVDNQIDPDLTVAMPELLLRQVVANLVDNAVKYRNRAVTLHLDVTAAVVDGEVELTVADNGPGVPSTDRERIFDQGVRTSSERIAGTGLGLALCRDLVSDAHGSLTVSDNAPTGARFVVRLPTGLGVSEHPEITPADLATDLVSQLPASAETPLASGTGVPSGIDLGALERYRPDEILVRHSSGRVVHVSPPGGFLDRLLGGSRQSTAERLHPDDAPMVVEAMQRATAEPGRSVEVAARVRHDGEGSAWTSLLLHVTHPLPEDDLGGVVIAARLLPEVADSGSLFDDLPFPALVIGHLRQLIVANDAARDRFDWDDIPVHSWSDDLPDEHVRRVVHEALESRTTTTWRSVDGGTTGVVAPLAGTEAADVFVIFLCDAPMQEVPISVGTRAVVSTAGPADYDPLTGLPAPGVVRAHLNRLLDETRHRSRSVAVVAIEVLDLDVIEADHGPGSADTVLQVVADRLRTSAGDVDAVSRRSGGEFLLVLHELVSVEDAIRVVDRIRAHLQAPVVLGTGRCVPRVAAGVAVVEPEVSTDADLVLIAAEQAVSDARSGSGAHLVRVS